MLNLYIRVHDSWNNWYLAHLSTTYRLLATRLLTILILHKSVICKLMFFFLTWAFSLSVGRPTFLLRVFRVFGCVFASLWECFSVRRSVRQSGPSIKHQLSFWEMRFQSWILTKKKHELENIPPKGQSSLKLWSFCGHMSRPLVICCSQKMVTQPLWESMEF